MEVDKRLRLLGLCKRGGMLIIGEDAIGKACRVHPMKKSKAILIVMAHDVSDNTRKRIESHARAGNIQLVELPHDRETLGHALGLANCAAAAVTDAKLAEVIRDTEFSAQN